MKQKKLTIYIILILSFMNLSCYISSQPLPIATETKVNPTIQFTVEPPVMPTFNPPQVFTVLTDLEKRACPSVSCANVGYFHEGDTIQIDGWLYDATLNECQRWGHVLDTEYWVCANYLGPVVFVQDEVYVPLDYDPNWYEICGKSAPVYGRPAGTNVLYVLPVGTRVRIREMSQGTLGWAMIQKARWVLLEYLCRL